MRVRKIFGIGPFRKLATEAQEDSGVLGCHKFWNWPVWETGESGSAQSGVGAGGTGVRFPSWRIPVGPGATSPGDLDGQGPRRAHGQQLPPGSATGT